MNVQWSRMAVLLGFLLPACLVGAPDQARNGEHDFDFELGNWTTHLKVLAHPLTGSTTWTEMNGTSGVRKIWNGRANMVELEVDGPSGHIEALSLRLYNPESHQWSLNVANGKSGTLGVPTIGEFKNWIADDTRAKSAPSSD